MSTTVYPKILKERYELDDVLGEGGMGTVYRCVDKRTQRHYAVKFLTVDQILSESGMRRFEHECQLLGKLNHANIVGLRDHGVEEGMPYLIMELCVNQRRVPYTLRSLQHSFPSRRLPPDMLLSLLPGMLDSVALLHGHGLVHRDLKPDNILLSEVADGIFVPKLTDFGLIALTIDNATRNQYDFDIQVSMQDNSQKAKAWVGTYTFMSPEQKRGEMLDARSDVYALGLIIYRLATGYERLNPELPSDINPEYEEWIDLLIEKALEEDPEDRWQSAAHMFEELPAELQATYKQWVRDQVQVRADLLQGDVPAQAPEAHAVDDDSSEIFDSVLDHTDAAAWAEDALHGHGTKASSSAAHGKPDDDDDDDDEEFDPSMLSDWATDMDVSPEEAAELQELAALAELARTPSPASYSAASPRLGARASETAAMPTPAGDAGTQKMIRADVATIPALVAALDDGDSHGAEIAKRNLAKFGASDVPEITRAYGSPFAAADERRAALIAIEYIGDLALPVLLQQLRGPDDDAREFAVDALTVLGASVMPSVVQLLIHKKSVVRKAAVEVLGRIGDVQATTALLPALRDQDADVRAAAMEALSRQDDTAPRTADLDLDDDDDEPAAPAAIPDSAPAAKAMGPPGVQPEPTPAPTAASIAAAERIKALHTPAPGDVVVVGSSKEEIERALADENWQVRAKAVESLSQSRQADAAMTLTPALQDENWRVRSTAMDAMVRIGDNALPALITTFNDADWTVRSTVVEAFGKIGGMKALTILLQVVQDPDASVRRAAADSIGTIGGVTVKQSVLAQLSAQEPDLRRQACEAVCELEFPRTIEGIAPLLMDPDQSVRTSAAEAIAKLRELEIISQVYMLSAEDRYATVRRAASNALEAIDDADPVPMLIDALGDKEWQVRSTAADALVSMGLYAKLHLTDVLADSNHALYLPVKEVLDRMRRGNAGKNSGKSVESSPFL